MPRRQVASCLTVIVDCAVYEGGVRRPGALPVEAALEAVRDADDAFVWIGLLEPSPDELAAVSEEFALHPLSVEDAVHAHQRPKLERFGDSCFLVIKTVRYVDPQEIIAVGEVMLFVGSRFLISVRHGTGGDMGAIRRELEADPVRLARGPGEVVHTVVDHVVDEYAEALRGVEEDIDEIQAQVFSGVVSASHGERIFRLKREVLEFRQAVIPLADPLEELLGRSVPGVDEALKPYFRDVHDHLVRVSTRLEGIDDLLTSALNANVAQVAMRQNEDMRKISAWVAILAVPTMIAGIYGMNFEHMPELESRLGYPVVLVVIAIACYGLYRNFKHRGWL